MAKLSLTGLMLLAVWFIFSAIATWFKTDVDLFWKIVYTAGVLFPSKYIFEFWYLAITE